MFTTLLFLSLSIGGPENITYVKEHKKEAMIAIYAVDVLFGCLKSGIGNWSKSSSFAKDCFNGGFVGGSTVFAGTLVAAKNNTFGLGAVGKLTNDLGVSFQDNAMRGKRLTDQFQTDVGIFDLTIKDYSISNVRLSLTSTVGMAREMLKGNKFDAKLSVSNLTPVFKYNDMLKFGRYDVFGYSTGSVIAYYDNPAVKEVVMPHEMIHVLQYSRTRFCDFDIDSVPKLFNHLSIGRDICIGIASLPSQSVKTYFYSPMELEAYTLER